MEPKRDKRGRTEAEAIIDYQTKEYPKPAMTADVALFAKSGEKLWILLIRRGNHPFLGYWALPGGFANKNEGIQQTAFRELKEETGVHCSVLQLVGIYSEPGRDPRGWIISAAYTACLKDRITEITGKDDAVDARWIEVKFVNGQPAVILPPGDSLAFDHEKIIADAIKRNNLYEAAQQILEWLYCKNQ